MRHAYDLEREYFGPSTDLSGLRHSLPLVYRTHGSRKGRRAQRRAWREARKVGLIVRLHRLGAWLVGGE